jgi:hypothetical protein
MAGAAGPGVLSISTLYDASGNITAQIEIDCDDTTLVLTGATVTNNTGKKLSMCVLDATTNPPTLLKVFSIPAGVTTVTATQLKHAGYSTAADCNGLTFAQV